MSEQCICGGPTKALCPECARLVFTTGGKLTAHDRPVCLGSHLEWKGCKGSGKPIPIPIHGSPKTANENTPWEDKDDEWSKAIDAAFPTRSGSHDQYSMAMKMVGNRQSKSALVELVNWLLVSKGTP
jgi:hypothetical protein